MSDLVKATGSIEDDTDEENSSTSSSSGTLTQSECCNLYEDDSAAADLDDCFCDICHDICPSDSEDDICGGILCDGIEPCNDWMALMNCAIDTERRIIRTLDLRRQVLDQRMHRLLAEMQLEKQLLRLAIDDQIEQHDNELTDCSRCLN